MRDIQRLLERWAEWARLDNGRIDYSSTAAGFKGLLPQGLARNISCSDSDGLIIEGCITQLRIKKYDEYYVLVLYYLKGFSKRSIAKKMKKDEKLIRIQMQMAEAFVEGCLSMIDVVMDMDMDMD